MLDERKLEVLRAIITDYVATREPVGSKALVERHHLDVSPATVRNDMAVLEEEGYLAQPHTSAGRVPTDKGYRLFVDRLAQVKPLSSGERRAIQTFMAGAVDVDDIVHRTVHLLAQLTRQVAIVQYPVSNSTTLRHLELVSLSPERVLVIVIDSTGRIEQRSVRIDDHTEEELVRWRSVINNAVVGTRLGQAVDILADSLQLPPEDYARCQPLIDVISTLLATDPSTEVVVAGVPNLTRYGESYETAIRPVLEALEEQVVLLRLLGEAVSTSPGDVTVRIGQENPYAPLKTTSLVASPYGGTHETLANLGVVGPTYMDYPSTISAVRAVARYLGRFLSEG